MNALLKASDVAAILQVSARQVSERYAHSPGFPDPIRLPSKKGQGLYRWKREEIEKWAASLRVKK